jgi:ABC-type metal ion transport system substrate-binding protein
VPCKIKNCLSFDNEMTASNIKVCASQIYTNLFVQKNYLSSFNKNIHQFDFSLIGTIHKDVYFFFKKKIFSVT